MHGTLGAVPAAPQAAIGALLLAPAPLPSVMSNAALPLIDAPGLPSPRVGLDLPVPFAQTLVETPAPAARSAWKTIRAAAPSARETPLLRAGLRTAVSVLAPGRAKNPAVLERVLRRLFEGKAAASQQPEAVSVQGPRARGWAACARAALQRPALAAEPAGKEDYLAHPPLLPLARLGPDWQKAAGPKEGNAAYRLAMGESRQLASDAATWTFDEKLAFEATPGILRTALSPTVGEDKVLRTQWTIEGTVRRAGVVESGIVWTDENGLFHFYDAKKSKTSAVVLENGRVDAFVPGPSGNHVYVVSNGILQHWNLDTRQAHKVVKNALDLSGEEVLSLLPQKSRQPDGSEVSGVLVRTKNARIFWMNDILFHTQLGEEKLFNEFGTIANLHPYGDKFFLERTDAGTRVWRKSWQGSWTHVQDIGELPYKAHAIMESPERGVYFAAVEDGLLEWDTLRKRCRVYPVESLKEAAAGKPIGLELVLNRTQTAVQKAVLSAGKSIFQLDIAEAKSALDGATAQTRLWSQSHPMSIQGGVLRIGEFSFPIQKRAPVVLPWRQRAFNALLSRFGRRTLPEEAESLGITEKEWKAVNLPTNKKLIYETLKAFSLNQHVLYVGETGGGKTWLMEMIAKLTGSRHWLVSMNEYTRNKDLIARETFGEEAKNRTGLTPSVILRWMVEGGLLGLDEIHKPLEGIAIINNILQNGEYRMPDGRVIRYDPAKSWVIATMNPAKPPYKGEPLSGELASRFGLTLEVNYLPKDEEEALISIFMDGNILPSLVSKLVDIARDLRKAYPEILPLPVSSRTLLYIAKHLLRFPDDGRAEIFAHSYNPSAILPDPAVTEAIARILQAHDLDGALTLAPLDRPDLPASPSAAKKAAALSPQASDLGDGDVDDDSPRPWQTPESDDN